LHALPWAWRALLFSEANDRKGLTAPVFDFMFRSGASLQDHSRTLCKFAKFVLSAVLACAPGMSATAVAGTMTPLRADTEIAKPPAPFYPALTKALKKRKTKLEQLCPVGDFTARRVLEEYGAMFLATKKVTPPPVCVFLGDEDVAAFQNRAGFVSETIGDTAIELQPAAMKAYLKARDRAMDEGLDITPRDGPDAARRSYSGSLSLWNTRFIPALDYWATQGRLTPEQTECLKALPLKDQIAAVLDLERGGVYFSKDFSKSILYSIAAPGSSQHLAMLALDVTEFRDLRVRQLLADQGWFQTVLSDLPHFTYLGLKEKDLPKRGLKSVEINGQIFWIPNVEQTQNPPTNP
jgi:hypothetical protein